VEFGKIEYTCRDRGNGGSTLRTLQLTLVGLEDKDILAKRGVKGLRLNRIMRLTAEAAEQGCLLSYEDLSALLLTSLATLKRDISFLEKTGNPAALKGRRRNGTAVRKAGGTE
jgi:hypothetical protein